MLVELPERRSLLRAQVGDFDGVIPAAFDLDKLLTGGAAGMAGKGARCRPAFFHEVHF